MVEFALHPHARPIYLKIANILSHSEARSLSCFDGAGCAALTGSEAGKLSTRPASSLVWVSRSALAASRGSAACLSCAAGGVAHDKHDFRACHLAGEFHASKDVVVLDIPCHARVEDVANS